MTNGWTILCKLIREEHQQQPYTIKSWIRNPAKLNKSIFSQLFAI